jgi:hypothetical protein
VVLCKKRQSAAVDDSGVAHRALLSTASVTAELRSGRIDMSSISKIRATMARGVAPQVGNKLILLIKKINACVS